MGGHEVDGLDGAQRNDPVVLAAITHDADGAHRQEDGERLADLVVEVGLAQLFDEDGVSLAQQVAVLFLHFAKHAHAQARTREGVTVEHVVGQAEFEADAAHFVLEQLAQRLHQTHLHLFRQAADVVVGLDDVGLAGLAGRGFDDVRVDGALGQPLGVLELLGLVVEHVHEDAADGLALGFRLVDTRESGEEALFRVDLDDVQAEVIAEHVHHLLAFVQAQQTVVNEDAGQAIADGAVHQHGDHGGVHAAGEAQDHLVVTHLLADAGNGVVDDGGRGPEALAAADVLDEVLQHAGTLTGVGHFRVELHAVEALGFVGHGGVGAGRGLGDGGEAGGDLGDLVAVAHPDIQQGIAVVGNGVFDVAQESAGLAGLAQHFDLGVAEFTQVGGLHLAAELLGHGLHAVADTEHRHTGVEHVLGGARAARLGHGFRAAGEDDAARVELADLLFGYVPGPQLAVDADFTDATGDELGVLGTEIQDKDTVGVNVFSHFIPASG